MRAAPILLLLLLLRLRDGGVARILVLEGNTPELCAGRTARGLRWTAEAFGDALARYAPEIRIEVARPYFDGYASAAVPVEAVDGVVCTGSGVEWTAADARAAPFHALFERAFGAGRPVLGCCWGLQVGAVVLGGRVGAGPNGIEAGVARDVALTPEGAAHPLHAGRAPRFDVLCMHRDDVLEPPPGAEVTATNAHSAVQGMVHAGAGFWGLQYHPEIGLRDVAYYASRSSGAFAAYAHGAELVVGDFEAIAAGRDADGALAARHDLGATILDPWAHGIELANWLRAVVPAPASA